MLIAFPTRSIAPATVPRRAALDLPLSPACVRWHFQNESEDSDDRTTPDPAGSSRMVASIELSTRYPPAASRGLAEVSLDEAQIAELHAHFSSAYICELGTVMAVIAGMAKLSFVMDPVEKESYRKFATG